MLTDALSVGPLRGPDALLQWVVQLEAEAVLLAGPLDQVTAREQDGAHPVAVLWAEVRSGQIRQGYIRSGHVR